MVNVSQGRFTGSGAVAASMDAKYNGGRVTVYFASDGVLNANVLTVDRLNKDGDRYRLFSHDFAAENSQYASFSDYWNILTGDNVEVSLSAGGNWTLEILVATE